MRDEKEGALLVRCNGGHDRFADREAAGAKAENAVSALLTRRDYSVTKLAAPTHGDEHCPRLIMELAGLVVAPDLLAVRPNGRSLLIAVKAKSAWAWHGRSRAWTTGISAAELNGYAAAEAATGLPVVLAFVMPGAGDRPVYRAPAPPSGVFAGHLRRLRTRSSHVWGRGAGAMIFWTSAGLCRVPGLDDLEPGVTQ